jgi:hypothetical protein
MSADRAGAPAPAGHGDEASRARPDASSPAAAVLPAVPRRAAAAPIFLHSSWRTASTWFWLKFRGKPSTLCYYEPFHEALATLTREQAQTMGPGNWTVGESRHPDGAPYFLEFRPLLRRAGGVRLYRPEIAYDWFVPMGGLAGELRPQEHRYVGLLLRHACRRGKVAVFGFTRSLGRLAALKRRFGGTHIFLYRNLWTQWASYVGQSAAGNRYFLAMLLRILLRAEDRFLAAALNRSLLRATARGLPAAGGDALVERLLDALSEAELFGLFMAVHGYLYIAAQLTADLSIDATRLARDRRYREATSARLAAKTGLAVDLADARDVPQAHWVAADGIDWREIEDTLAFAGHALDHLFAPEEIARVRAQLLADTRAEMRAGERYLAGPRAEIARLTGACAALTAERDALRGEVARLAGERDGLAAAHKAAAAERDAAVAERDELARTVRRLQQQHDAAAAECERLAQDRAALAAELGHAEAAREAAVAERDELARTVRRLQEQHDAAAAECERLAQDRAALAAELWRAEAAREAAVAERDGAVAAREAALAALARLRERGVRARLRRLGRRLGLRRGAGGSPH